MWRNWQKRQSKIFLISPDIPGSHIIDPSVALAWLLPDETNARADAVREAVQAGADAWIPTHW